MSIFSPKFTLIGLSKGFYSVLLYTESFYAPDHRSEVFGKAKRKVILN